MVCLTDEEMVLVGLVMSLARDPRVKHLLNLEHALPLDLEVEDSTEPSICLDVVHIVIAISEGTP